PFARRQAGRVSTRPQRRRRGGGEDRSRPRSRGRAPTRSVFVAEWLEPPYAAGHWIPEMVEIAGGRDVLGHAGAPSYPTSWETVQEAQPELVVVAPCGFDHTRAAREAALPPL